MKIFIFVCLFLVSVTILTSCENEEKEEKEIQEKDDIRKPKKTRHVGVSKVTPAGVGFKFEEIIRDGEADKLFKMFLEKVAEKKVATNNIFKISEISKYIPYNEVKNNLNNIDEDMYNYYVLLMLSGQLNRDYFIYMDEPNLRYEFTDISNEPDRNNAIWKTKYSEVEFRINPKYVRL